MNAKKLFSELTVAIVLLSGCVNKGELVEDDKGYALDELYKEIVNFEQENGYNNATRGIWDKLGKVAAWDGSSLLLTSGIPVASYFISGVVSFFAAIFIFWEDAYTPPIGPGSTDRLRYSAPSLNHVGEEHNSFLLQILKRGVRAYNSPQEMADEIISEYRQKDSLFPFSSYEHLVQVCPLIEEVFSCTNEAELFSVYRNHLETPELVDIAEQVITTISSMKDYLDLSSYSEGVHSIINRSSVSEAEKEQLLQLLSVTAYSKALWDYEME